MPKISKSFTHTCAACTQVVQNVYNYNKTAVAFNYCYKEASQFFFEDLKEMLELTGLGATFSEEHTYNTKTDCPYFELFGIQMPFMVYISAHHSSVYSATPIFFRTGEYDNTYCIRQYGYGASNDGNNYLVYGNRASVATGYSTITELIYTINIVYGDNYIIATYTTHENLKYPLFSLIKGVDINNRECVYYTNSINAGATGESTTMSTSYHRLVFCDNWYVNPYNGLFRTPNSNTTYSGNPNYNGGQLFLKMTNMDTVAGVSIPDNRIQIQQPICCGNRIFFDNLYVVPDTVNIDSFYTINDELYYCPGDIVAQHSLQYNASAMSTYSLRFLLKYTEQ